MRLKTAAAALGLVAVNIANAHAATTAVVLLDRAIAGLLAGLLFGAANAIIVRSNNPDRLTGILCGASVVPQIGLAYLFPVLLIPTFGVAAALYALAAGGVIAALFAVTLVDKLSGLEKPERMGTHFSGAVLLFGGATVLQAGGLGAAWTYIERVASQHGFDPSVIGLAFSASLASQVAASWLSAWLVPKMAKWPTLLMLVLAQGGFVALAILTDLPTTFITAVCIFASAACALQAFQMAEIVRLDKTRRAAVLILPMILFGSGLGPLIASFATTELDVIGGGWAAVAMTATSFLFYAACASWSKRQRTTSLLETTPTLRQ
jgi:predicted MFS family arabinose efflux permease